MVIVKKKGGNHPFYRLPPRKRSYRTRRVTEPPFPQIIAILNKLRGAKYLITLDLKNGYWQVPLISASRSITAFTVPRKGFFQFKVMPFGLHSPTFQKLLDKILGPKLEPHVFVYFDDIIVTKCYI